MYGIQTEEANVDGRLKTIFNYDEIFGTIVNRFVVQAISGYPLTVYGKGGQTRGYLNIKDTLQCVPQSDIHPPSEGELRIFNQIMETFSVNDLAYLTEKVGRNLGYKVEIKNVPNPRKELEQHYYNPIYDRLLYLGVEPHYLNEESMAELFRIVEKYRKNINKDIMYKGIMW